MTRAILIVLDSVGSAAPRMPKATATRAPTPSATSRKPAPNGHGDREGLQAGPAAAAAASTALGLGLATQGFDRARVAGFCLPEPRGQWGFGVETSRGKDTPSGHWEIAGMPVDFDWGYFPETIPAFPAALSEALIAQGKLAGILGDRHASGTAIIDELGEEHLRNGEAHLLHLRRLACSKSPRTKRPSGSSGSMSSAASRAGSAIRCNIGRVIARPFVGGAARTSCAPPTARISRFRRPTATILQRAARAGSVQSSRSARSATSSPIATPATSARARATTAMSTPHRGAGDAPRRGLHLRQSGRFRHRVRPPPRRSRLCGRLEAFDRRVSDIEAALRPQRLSASSPPTTATTRPSAAPTTPASISRSSPSAPARPPARWRAREASPTSPRRSPRNLGLPRGSHGTPWKA